jgi:murein L,D-transpeptidase YafK
MKKYIQFSLLLLSSATLAMSPKPNWNEAIDRAISKYGLRTEPQLKELFTRANVSYPPQNIELIALKKEKRVELWAKSDEDSPWKHVHNYALTAFSGHLGPKLKERDGQIPEGIYKLVNFNPFSSMHLSMMINYPNDFDKTQAAHEGRRNLGNNIYIHGKDLSVGCLAIGDWGIDQLFLLARRVGLKNIELIIAPNDLRQSKPATNLAKQPKWLPMLYNKITYSMAKFK